MIILGWLDMGIGRRPYHAIQADGWSVCQNRYAGNEDREAVLARLVADPPMHLRCLQCVKQLAHAAASKEGEG